MHDMSDTDDTLPTFNFTFIHSTKRKFDDEYFRFFMFLVLVQCIVNALFARAGQFPWSVMAYVCVTVYVC